MITFTVHENDKWTLTEEGQQIADHGSHEKRVLSAIPPSGLPIKDLSSLLPADVAKIGQGQAFKNKWIKKDGDKLVALISPDSVQDQAQVDLRQIMLDGGRSVIDNNLKELKKRKLCDKVKVVHFSIEKGPHFSLNIEKPATDLTVELLQS